MRTYPRGEWGAKGAESGHFGYRSLIVNITGFLGMSVKVFPDMVS